MNRGYITCYRKSQSNALGTHFGCVTRLMLAHIPTPVTVSDVLLYRIVLSAVFMVLIWPLDLTPLTLVTRFLNKLGKWRNKLGRWIGKEGKVLFCLRLLSLLSAFNCGKMFSCAELAMFWNCILSSVLPLLSSGIQVQPETSWVVWWVNVLRAA